MTIVVSPPTLTSGYVFLASIAVQPPSKNISKQLLNRTSTSIVRTKWFVIFTQVLVRLLTKLTSLVLPISTFYPVELRDECRSMTSKAGLKYYVGKGKHKNLAA